VDLLGNDACLMGMAEVAREVSDSVDFFAGSEETEPGAGWPYNTFLQAWAAKPKANGGEVAQMLTETYVKSYVGQNEVTFSAFDLSHMAELTTAVTELGNKVLSLSAAAKKKMIRTVNDALSFTYSDYIDLGHMVDLLAQARVAKIDSKTLANLKTAIGRFVIAVKSTERYEHAQGVSMWVPTSRYTFTAYTDKYDNLTFNKETNWNDALKYLLANPQDPQDPEAPQSIR
jgi:hypothetical protein